MRRADHGEDDPETQYMIRELASSYEAVGRANDAISLLEKIVASRKSPVRPRPPHPPRQQGQPGTGVRQRGPNGRCGEDPRRGRRRLPAQIPPTFIETLIVTIQLADAYEKANRLDLATSTYRELLTTSAALAPTRKTCRGSSEALAAFCWRERHSPRPNRSSVSAC